MTPDPSIHRGPDLDLHIQTPLIQSPILSAGQQEVWLKMEAFQPSGSFKIRGIGRACTIYAQRGAARFVAASGGNAGIAVAYAGRALSIPVVTVVPQTTSVKACDVLRLYGAEVIIAGENFNEANRFAQSLLQPTDAFIHPFDDPFLWSGHASMVDEIKASNIRPDAIVLSVGGGGLLAGVAEGLNRQGWGHIPIIATETYGAASLHASLQAGKLTSLEEVATLATSLAAKQICGQAWEVCQTNKVISARVSDAQAVKACEAFLEDHRVLVEPACGASLALAYSRAKELADLRKIVIIVCGGATMSPQMMATWLEQTSSARCD